MRSKDDIVNDLQVFLEELYGELRFNLTSDEVFWVNHSIDEITTILYGEIEEEHEHV